MKETSCWKQYTVFLSQIGVVKEKLYMLEAKELCFNFYAIDFSGQIKGENKYHI